jgi:hypothetical protein
MYLCNLVHYISFVTRISCTAVEDLDTAALMNRLYQ